MQGPRYKIACNIIQSLLIGGFRKALNSSILPACTGDGRNPFCDISQLLTFLEKRWNGQDYLQSIIGHMQFVLRSFIIHLLLSFSPDVGPVSQLHYLSSKGIDIAVLKQVCYLSPSFTPRVGKMENKWVTKN